MVPYAFDFPEVDQLFTILRLGQNQDSPYLGHGLGENRWWEHRLLALAACQIAFIERHVLDADDTRVLFELDDAIDQQEGLPVWKDPFDCCVVER